MSDSQGDTDTDYLVIETSAPQLDTVRLYDETWAKIRRDHEEFAADLPSHREMVEDTIANPTEVYASNGRLPGTAFIFASSNNTLGGHPCIVPVKVYQDTTSGRVATALFTDRPSGALVWRADDDA